MTMFLDIVIFSIEAARQRAEHERKTIDAARIAMSPGEFAAWLSDRQKAQDKAREEATAERRHKETCDAIRSTSFWRFGA